MFFNWLCKKREIWSSLAFISSHVCVFVCDCWFSCGDFVMYSNWVLQCGRTGFLFDTFPVKFVNDWVKPLCCGLNWQKIHLLLVVWIFLLLLFFQSRKSKMIWNSWVKLRRNSSDNLVELLIPRYSIRYYLLLLLKVVFAAQPSPQNGRIIHLDHDTDFTEFI